MRPMPDPLYAKESVWVPFITDVLGGFSYTRDLALLEKALGLRIELTKNV